MPGDRFEVIVVDNGSTDGTGEAIRAYDGPIRPRYLREERPGRAAACNAGLSAATGRVVVLLDDDMLPEPGWLMGHLAAHRAGASEGPAPIAVVGAAPGAGTPASPAGRYLQARFDRHLEKLARGAEMTFRDVYTGNFSIARDVLAEAGGFDEGFTSYGNEDGELAIRLRNRGVRLVYAPEAAARQGQDKDLARAVADARAKGRNAVRLAERHPEARDLLGFSRPASRRRRAFRRAAIVAARVAPPLARVPLALIERIGRRGPGPLDRIVEPILDAAYALGVDDARRAGQVVPVLPARTMAGPAREGARPERTDGSLPPVSLILSTRNRPDFVTDVLASVLAGTHVPAEFVIVDQSDHRHPALPDVSHDGGCEVRYLWSRERGLSRGRNAGIVAASHDIVAFLDDDVVVPATWFDTLITALLASPPRTVVTGQVASGGAEVDGGFAPSTSPDALPRTWRGRIGQDVLLPHNMALSRAAFEEVGLFDPRLGAGSHFPSSEDNDFGYRLLEAGYGIRYVPEAVLVHRAWRAPAAWIPLRWAYGRGQGAYFAKHASLRDRYMLRRLWRDAARHARRAPRQLLAHPRRAAGDLVYAAAVLIGAAEWTVRSWIVR